MQAVLHRVYVSFLSFCLMFCCCFSYNFHYVRADDIIPAPKTWITNTVEMVLLFLSSMGFHLTSTAGVITDDVYYDVESSWEEYFDESIASTDDVYIEHDSLSGFGALKATSEYLNRIKAYGLYLSSGHVIDNVVVQSNNTVVIDGYLFKYLGNDSFYEASWNPADMVSPIPLSAFERQSYSFVQPYLMYKGSNSLAISMPAVNSYEYAGELVYPFSTDISLPIYRTTNTTSQRTWRIGNASSAAGAYYSFSSFNKSYGAFQDFIIIHNNYDDLFYVSSYIFRDDITPEATLSTATNVYEAPMGYLARVHGIIAADSTYLDKSAIWPVSVNHTTSYDPGYMGYAMNYNPSYNPAIPDTFINDHVINLPDSYLNDRILTEENAAGIVAGLVTDSILKGDTAIADSELTVDSVPDNPDIDNPTDDGLFDWLSKILNSILGLSAGIGAAIKQVLDNLGITNILNSILNAITSGVSSIVNAINSLIGDDSFLDSTANYISNLFSSISAWFGGLPLFIPDGIMGGMNWVIAQFNHLTSNNVFGSAIVFLLTISMVMAFFL